MWFLFPWFTNISMVESYRIGTILACGSVSISITPHDDVIKWKHFPRHWTFVRGIHRSPVNSPHKGHWRGALLFSLICAFNKRLSKRSWGWWFETPSRSLWRHCNGKTHFTKFINKFLKRYLLHSNSKLGTIYIYEILIISLQTVSEVHPGSSLSKNLYWIWLFVHTLIWSVV